MVSQADRIHFLDDALARALPQSREWRRDQRPGDIGEPECWIEVHSPRRTATQRLVVLLRHDGDIQVEYHIANKRGSPFGMHIVLTEGQEAAASEAVSLFVADTFLRSGSCSPSPRVY